MNVAYAHGFVGGMIIGLAAVVLFLCNGRIMGVSGITSKLLAKPNKDFFWRAAFVLGLILGGFVVQLKFPVDVVVNSSTQVLIVAGLLVGVGTVMGSGCTSGHGICGIARISKRSIVATIVFMSTGIIAVLLKKIFGA